MKKLLTVLLVSILSVASYAEDGWTVEKGIFPQGSHDFIINR
jgi:hypothetical protein